MSSDVIPLAVDALTDDSPTFQALLALNTAHDVELSPLDATRLRHLLSTAFLACRIGDVAAFLIAFDQDAEYDSPNFLWFRERYPRFVYVDRIVVAAAARGQGHAQRLYQHLFQVARQAGHAQIVCEVNSSPPNPASDAFHKALGFVAVGEGPVAGTDKTVRYLRRRIAPDVA